ncbi:hypothetical protein [Veillonella sp. VA141]|uniref:hypothetical protein n=1 Tax=Veillonella sp. VA141 TaxID=741833 RepID=UPI000F8D63C7|nr:hypothetical protein [Veillonella sp. VA141]
MKDKLQLVKEKMQNAYLMKVAGLTTFFLTNTYIQSFATTVNGAIANAGGNVTTGTNLKFDIPIIGFFLSIIDFMTGPFALVVGGLFIGAAAFLMMKGNAGGSLEKILYACFGVGIIMFLGPILGYLWTAGKSSGMMIGL